VLAGHFGGTFVVGNHGFVTKGAWDLFALRFDGAGTPVASRQFGALAPPRIRDELRGGCTTTA